jgi:hypothetical protein
MKVNFKPTIAIILFITVTYSCVDKKKNEDKKEIQISLDKESNEENLCSTVSIFLPDSLNIDSLLIGHIKYETAQSPVSNEKVSKKYTFLYATISDKKINSLSQLMEVSHDTFVPIDGNIIPIYDLRSKERGQMWVQGYLIDQFFYKKSEDSVRIISQDRKIDYPIIVYGDEGNVVK